MSLFFLCIILLWIYFGNLLYDMIFNRKKADTKIIQLDETKAMELLRNRNRDFRILKEQNGFEEIYIKGRDSNKLHAYYLCATSLNWVILCHDYLEDAKAIAPIARMYAEKNYNVLMIDARGHGKSDGNILSLGIMDSADLMQWMAYIIGKCPNARIVLHGISMGAVTILLNGSRFPSNVVCLISENAYTSIYDLLYYQFHLRFGILTSPLLLSLSFITKIRAGFTLKEASVLEKVQKNRDPILFLHTKEDDWVPPIMMEALFNVCTSDKQKFLLQGEHGLGHFMDDRYEKTVNAFLERYMNRSL